MSGIVVARPVHGLFLQRRGGDGRHTTIQGQLGGLYGSSVPGSTSNSSSDPQGRQGITPGEGAACSGESIGSTRSLVCHKATARRRISGWPITSGRQASWTTVSVQAPTTISGPTPATSPRVIAIKGRESAIRRFSRKLFARQGRPRCTRQPQGFRCGFSKACWQRHNLSHSTGPFAVPPCNRAGLRVDSHDRASADHAARRPECKCRLWSAAPSPFSRPARTIKPSGTGQGRAGQGGRRRKQR